jgi:hypothetical protein
MADVEWQTQSAARTGIARVAFRFSGLKLYRRTSMESPVDCDPACSDSAVRVVLVVTREDWAIAQACWRLAWPA